MSNDLEKTRAANVPATGVSVIRAGYEEAMRLAEYMEGGHLLPKAVESKADAFIIMAHGASLGMEPMAALRNMHVIDGKPSLSADAMLSLVLSSGAAEFWVMSKYTADTVTVMTKRRPPAGASDAVLIMLADVEPTSVTWTMARAKESGVATGVWEKNWQTKKSTFLPNKLKDNWANHPAAMLKARAITELARAIYPDVVSGVYDPDELDRPAQRQEAQDVEHTTSKRSLGPRGPKVRKEEEPPPIEAEIVDEPKPTSKPRATAGKTKAKAKPAAAKEKTKAAAAPTPTPESSKGPSPAEQRKLDHYTKAAVAADGEYFAQLSEELTRRIDVVGIGVVLVAMKTLATKAKSGSAPGVLYRDRDIFAALDVHAYADSAIDQIVSHANNGEHPEDLLALSIDVDNFDGPARGAVLKAAIIAGPSKAIAAIYSEIEKIKRAS